jgi:hypothetical protein
LAIDGARHLSQFLKIRLSPPRTYWTFDQNLASENGMAMFVQTENVPSPVLLEGRQLKDRRHTPRVPVLMAAWLWRTEDPEEAQVPLAIQILDYSERGVGFLSSLPLDVGEHVDLDMDGDGRKRTRVKVTHCALHAGDFFRIGSLCVTKK